MTAAVLVYLAGGVAFWVSGAFAHMRAHRELEEAKRHLDTAEALLTKAQRELAE